jgi:hypothetical protein
MKILRTVTLDSATRRKDKSVAIKFTTNTEQSSEQFMELDQVLNTSGVLYFKSHGSLTQEEVDALDDVDIELEGKTKSQRLRNVLYVLHKETNSQQDFKDFYSNKMESLIAHFKGQIPE